MFGCISVISCAATLAAARGPFSLDRSGAGIWCGVLVSVLLFVVTCSPNAELINIKLTIIIHGY